MQAIKTKFAGATNTKGSRVIASAEYGRMILGWDHSLNSEDNHIAAAKALVAKLDWKAVVIGSGWLGESEYCHLVKPVKGGA